jgi:hypothetical protein
MEIPLDYLNKVANQTFFVSALLGGFSLSTIIMLIDNPTADRLRNNMLRLATVAASSFLVSIFSMTKILMMTTEGFPIAVEYSDLATPRIIGLITFLLGILSMMGLISLSGWTKSKSLGIYTTIIGIISTILILTMLF